MGTKGKRTRNSQVTAAPVGNKLLAVLPEASRRALSEGMESIELNPKQILHGRNATLRCVYFPSSGLITLMMPTNGRTVEVSMIGDEGMFGLPLFFGVDRCPMVALAQSKGEAIRMQQRFFREQVRKNVPFATVLGRYAQAFTVMLAQGAACNSVHVIEQRCARWLLMAHDRLHVDEFPMTQDFLAQMLAVRRPSVSEVAKRLQDRGLIRYWQGRISILDRKGLEALSCNCYSVIRRELEWTTSSGK